MGRLFTRWHVGCAVSTRSNGLNQKDRLYVQRELIAWANWVRQGCTFPNALGYKSSTVEYSLMRGETGGDSQGAAKVPTRFNVDRNVEKVQKTFTRLPQTQQEAITGVYLYRMQAQRIALIVGVSKHKIQLRLWDGYRAVYDGLTNETKSH